MRGYFNPNVTYLEKYFRWRFQMWKSLFLTIARAMENYDDWIKLRRSASSEMSTNHWWSVCCGCLSAFLLVFSWHHWWSCLYWGRYSLVGHVEIHKSCVWCLWPRELEGTQWTRVQRTRMI
jgi:hypothetical protein